MRMLGVAAAIIHMAAIAEAASVAEAVSNDDVVSVIHEVCCLAPSTLIEIAGRSYVMAGVRNVAAASKAADGARAITVGDEIRNQCLKTAREMARNRDRPCRRANSDKPAAVRRVK